MIKPQLLLYNDWGFIIINRINKDVNNGSKMNGYLLGLLNDYLLIKEGVIIVRQIRKPTRQVCGVGIHVFCDRDIKRTLNNQEYPAIKTHSNFNSRC